MLQDCVGVAKSGISAKLISEGEMIPPERAVNRGEMQVISTRISPAEELASWDLLLSAMHIARPREHLDVGLHRRTLRISCENVENGLGCQSRNGGATRMLDDQRDLSGGEALPQPLRLRCTEAG